MKAINEHFQCINCKQEILPAQKTYRNHCPHCFTSVHVDGPTPGDRGSKCYGIMTIIEIDIKAGGGARLLFECTKCGKHHRNKTANDDDLVSLFIKNTNDL